jgi:hypothetical protein
VEKLRNCPGLGERMTHKGRKRLRAKYDVHKVNATIMDAMGL